MKKELIIGFSPCPNDTFIFDALVHNKIDTEGFTFIYETHDVEALNFKASQHKFDITKLSFFAYPYVSNHYQLLNSGSALGNNCGPLLISKKEYAPVEVPLLSIAIPGLQTTAHFLLTFAFPSVKSKTELVFSEIESALISGRFDAGVIIHENRFTYEQKGLHKIVDLGEYWEIKTGHPIPLGGIAIRREFPDEMKRSLNRIMQKSVMFAMQNPDSSADFVAKHAQEMHYDVMKKHIALYVNKYSISLDDNGKEAIRFMFDYAFNKGLIAKMPEDIFV